MTEREMLDEVSRQSMLIAKIVDAVLDHVELYRRPREDGMAPVLAVGVDDYCEVATKVRALIQEAV